jgi:outer membrane lipoprotein-sorting protein
MLRAILVLLLVAPAVVQAQRPDPATVLSAMEAAVRAARTTSFYVHTVRALRTTSESQNDEAAGYLTIERLDRPRVVDGFPSTTVLDSAQIAARMEAGMRRSHQTRRMRFRAALGDSLVVLYDGDRSAAFHTRRRAAEVDTTGASWIGARANGLSGAAVWFENGGRSFLFNAALESARTAFVRTDTVGGVVCDVIEVEPFANYHLAIERQTRIIDRVCVGREDHFPRWFETHHSSPAGTSRWAATITKLVVNPVLGPDTFSTRVPEGYTVRYETPPPPGPIRPGQR